MLNIKPTSSFTRDVHVSLPDGSKGKFKAKFKYLSRDEFQALNDKGLPDEDYLDEILLEVSGIGDGETEFPSEKQKEMVIGDLALSRATVREFAAGLTGAEMGNSKKSR